MAEQVNNIAQETTQKTKKTHNCVRLIKNHIYPTYQLFAQMANSRTSPERGMLIAVHTVLEWLANRMGENAPQNIKDAIDKGYDESILFNTHINEGYSIGIVYLKNKKAWCLQIVEPHLGSNPGEGQGMDEQAIPGRIIETDIEFRIVENTLECGFKTIISEREGLSPAKAYRLAPIKKLIENPEFGLKQVIDLTEECKKIESQKDVDNLVDLWKNSDNQLPIVVFSYRNLEQNSALEITNNSCIDTRISIPEEFVKEICKKAEDESECKKPQYDVEGFAKSCVGYGRTYLLSDEQKDYFSRETGIEFKLGEIVIMEPVFSDEEPDIIGFKKNDEKRKGKVKELNNTIHQYPCNKEIDFGHIGFFSIARALLAENVKLLESRINESDIEQQEQIATIRAQIEEQIKKADDEKDALNEKLSRKEDEINGHKKDKEKLRKEKEETEERCRKELEEKDKYIDFLKRKIDRSDRLEALADWSDKYFSDRIIFHDRARGMLSKNIPPTVDIDKIYDAVEYLATEFWENRYEGLSDDEVNDRCAEKYNRTMEVIPNGDRTISTYKNEYNVKYYNKQVGKEINTALKLHLRGGVDGEYIFRIYFFCDDENKKIVIGSLPRHLSTIKES